ncbi:hypothetical protein CF319_g2462 [Tilletia indica]|nr:hypothetical protein CF319_g2462 [Tilletia indica]
MDVLERLRRTPATKNLKVDVVCILLIATGLTLLREITMRLLLRPIGAKYVVSVSPDEPTTSSSKTQNGANGNGASSTDAVAKGSRTLSKRERRRLQHLQRHNESRFAEQGWSVLYYTCASLVGLYISVHQPWWPMNMKEFWTDYPELTIDALIKYYYLVQTGFYVHQMIVLHLEAPRKDHWQMFSHHVITIGLQTASYAVCYHRVGVAVMMLLDPCDVLLSAAKMLRYVGFQTLCDIFFGLFLLSWLVLRHVLYNCVLYSVMFDNDLYSDVGTRKSGLSKATITHILIAMLAVLQCILLMWFVMIVKVAYRVVTGSGAADTRSDDEDEDEFDSASTEDEVVSNGAKKNGRAIANSALEGTTKEARQRTTIKS